MTMSEAEREDEMRVEVKLPVSVVEKLEAIAVANGLTRPKMLRQMVYDRVRQNNAQLIADLERSQRDKVKIRNRKDSLKKAIGSCLIEIDPEEYKADDEKVLHAGGGTLRRFLDIFTSEEVGGVPRAPFNLDGSNGVRGKFCQAVARAAVAMPDLKDRLDSFIDLLDLVNERHDLKQVDLAFGVPTPEREEQTGQRAEETGAVVPEPPSPKYEESDRIIYAKEPKTEQKPKDKKTLEDACYAIKNIFADT